MEEGWRVVPPPPRRMAASETPENLKTEERSEVRAKEPLVPVLTPAAEMMLDGSEIKPVQTSCVGLGVQISGEERGGGRTSERQRGKQRVPF